ncbi:hypothetical protein [Acidiferrobacter sp. SPIII_3]|uniref:hypothetical protein n=1 Tax=Acidiferrobacter sp. SPIII_3 TaxID=1281578 RepID=UPI0011AB6703|nr:hypothetical protein [Acidiferrobacter sp. SPIII_3]
MIVRMRYVGSAVHKLSPGDYGFIPSCSPRPSKSSCDEIRTILKGEATELFRQGIAAGMVSKIDDGGVPKYGSIRLSPRYRLDNQAGLMGVAA